MGIDNSIQVRSPDRRARPRRLRSLARALFVWLAATSYAVAQDEVVFSGWSGEEPEARPIIMEMIERFNEQDASRNVTWVGWPWAQLQQNLVLRVRSNDAPHIAQIPDNTLATYAQLDALIDLNAVFGASTIADHVHPGLLGVGQYGGRQLGIPWVTGSISMVANSKVLGDSGIDAVPTTIDAFVDALRAIKEADPSSVPYGLSTQGAALIASDFQVWLWTFGGSIFDDDGNVVIDSPEAREALQFVVDLVAEGLAAPEMDRPTARTLFAQHRMGFYFDAPAARGTARVNSAEGIGFDEYISPVATPVISEGDRSYSIAWGHLLVMFKDANPDLSTESQAAQFLAHLVFDPEMPIAYFESRSQLPSNTAAIQSAAVQGDPFAAEWLSLASSTAKTDELSRWPNRSAMVEVVGEEVQAAMLGQKAPERALADAARRLEALVAQVR